MPRFDAKTSPAPPETPHRARRPVRQPAGRRLPDNDCRTLARQMPRKENLATSVTSISRRRLTLVGLSGHLELSRLLLIGLPELPSRSEEHTSELQSLMRISYAVFCLNK